MRRICEGCIQCVQRLRDIDCSRFQLSILFDRCQVQYFHFYFVKMKYYKSNSLTFALIWGHMVFMKFKWNVSATALGMGRQNKSNNFYSLQDSQTFVKKNWFFSVKKTIVAQVFYYKKTAILKCS